MLRYIRLNSRGQDVEAWNNFLRGVRPCSTIIVNELFSESTNEETKIFQRAVGLVPDGVVGNLTYAEAMKLGFSPLIDDIIDDQLSPNWPPKPNFSSFSSLQRSETFGKFAFTPAPTSGNPEGIKITDDWVGKNLVNVVIPQLKGVIGAPGSTRVLIHKNIAHQLSGLFAAWEDAGLLPLVKTWAGSWNPRFIRGSRSVLSNHAWATAFDINVQWNMLGTMPALKGKTGSVRELVPLANEWGWSWGGHWFNRPDGMHFEASKVLSA